MTSIIKVDTIQNSSGTSSLSIGADGFPTLDKVDYRSVIWPASDFVLGGADVVPATDFAQNIGDGVVIAHNARNDTDPYRNDLSISGFDSGVYEIHLSSCWDRSSSATETVFELQWREDDTYIAGTVGSAYDVYSPYDSASAVFVRDYTSAIPASVILRYECNRSNYLQSKGSYIYIKRIA